MTGDLLFDWDKANLVHIARHHIAPREIEQLFANEAVDIDFDVVDGEERLTSVGPYRRITDPGGRLDDCGKNTSGL